MNTEKILPTDELIHQGRIGFVQRSYQERKYDIAIPPDSATILYIDSEDHVFLVRQCRPAVQRETLELPAESLDKPGKTPLEVIVEGLEEECGIRIQPEQVQQLYLHPVNPSGGYTTEEGHLFSAKGPHEKTEQRLEDEERIKVVRIPFTEAYQMIGKEIRCAKSILLLQYEYIRRLEGEEKKTT